MTIKARLLSILTLIIVLLASTIIAKNIAYQRFEQQSQSGDKRYLSYLLADEFRQSSMDLTRLCRTFVATGDSAYWDAYWYIVQWRNGEVPRPANMDRGLYPNAQMKQRDIMTELAFSAQEFALLNEASNNSDALIATEDQAMRSIQQGKIVDGPHQPLPGESVKDFAVRIVFDQNYHDEVMGIMTPVNAFFSALDTRTASELRASRESAELWLSISLFLQLAVAGLVVVLAIFTLQKLFKPLQIAIEAMLNIGDGEGDLTKRLEQRGNNEITALARGFNLFASHIQKVILELRHAVEEIAQSSAELNVTANSTDKALLKQKQGIEQVLVAISQILPAVEEVAKNASQGLEQASLAEKAASGGMLVVNDVNGNISELETDMDNASRVISMLAKDTEEIGSILDVIRGVADQTNLLALNAAIEAARAGEQGRGFAVVADEVRTLAQRTQDSTAEIQTMIEKLQSGAQNAVEVINQSKARTDACVENSQAASQALQEISASVNAINNISQQIASATQEQTAAIASIQDSVDSINQEIENTSAASQQTSGTSEGTSRLAGHLQGLVSQFKA